MVPIQHPVPIPYQVLQLLKRHEYLVEVSDCLKQQMQEKKSFDQYLEYWLTASVIDLNEDGLDEMIVQVSEQYNFCLIGAGRGPFWVFQQAPEGYRLIFHTSAHDLKVLAAKAKGFHQLNIQAMTALELLTGTYEFDGSEYDSVTGSEHYGTIPIKQKFRKEIALALATNALVVLAWTQNVDYRPTLKEALHGNPEKLLILLKLTLNLNEKNHKNHAMILWRLLHFVGDKAFVSAFQKLSQPERVAVTKALTETSYTVRNPDDYLKLLFPQTHQVLFPEVTDSKAKA
ncbi:MAG: hypothetical protein K1Y36_18415 [Blastocatellia bacterium]|nr:hypothetical protein [Blastocatellia bacterium]